MTCWHVLLETDWGRELRPEFEKPYWATLHACVEEERTRHNVYPSHDEVFTAFRLTSCADTRVVILGQDPYPGVGQAHGLAFSVPCGVAKPPTLKNIHKELHTDLGVPIPSHGNLKRWAERGVLLLNATLTVREGGAGPQKCKGWETFTDRVIQIAAENPATVFILWGDEAQKKKRLIGRPGRIICSPHPAPLAAYKGFFCSRPFSRANCIRRSSGQEEIDWTLTECPDATG